MGVVLKPMQDFSHTEALHKYSYAEMVFTQEYIYTETVFHTILLQRGVFSRERLSAGFFQ